MALIGARYPFFLFSLVIIIKIQRKGERGREGRLQSRPSIRNSLITYLINNHKDSYLHLHLYLSVKKDGITENKI